MGDEVAKQPSYEERKAAIKEHTQEVMGDATPENFMRAAHDHTLVDEHRDLTEWYTQVYDNAVLSAYEKNGSMPNAALQSLARQEARFSEPEKYERLLMLERLIQRQNHTHQHVTSAGMASATQQTLEMEWLR